ncbi:type IV secretion system protein [Vibrio parahaemolyticus]|uniref:type IV secretion system protein n=1 Tax=Vibrio parahaemolyticus TaxID=670 RepID=UPI0011237377|nr:type IV secretion system protein [Vibrio parahaemolyticus]TOG88652.1 conjugal transfer protein TrbL [Vibrio parahaemolyticus]
MFDSLFDFLNQIVESNIAEMIGRFTTAFTPLLGACVMLYIVYMAWEMLFDRQNMVFMESLKTIGSLTMVTGVALNTAWYMSHVVPFILGSGDQVTQLLLGSGSGAGSALQVLFDRVWSDIGLMASRIEWEFDAQVIGQSLGIIAMIIISVLGFIPFIGIATAYLLMAKIMVSFLLIIGPLFIMMAFFPSTRSFFQAWTGQCFNYVLLSILFPLSFSLITSLLKETVFAGNITFVNVIFTAVIFFALCVLATQIPVLSSTLSGGVGISGLIGNAVQGAKATSSAAKTAKNAPGQIKHGVKDVTSKVQNIGKPNIKGG